MYTGALSNRLKLPLAADSLVKFTHFFYQRSSSSQTCIRNMEAAVISTKCRSGRYCSYSNQLALITRQLLHTEVPKCDRSTTAEV